MVAFKREQNLKELLLGISSSRKFGFLNETPLQMMKDTFYFTLETLFVFKIFKI